RCHTNLQLRFRRRILRRESSRFVRFDGAFCVVRRIRANGAMPWPYQHRRIVKRRFVLGSNRLPKVSHAPPRTVYLPPYFSTVAPATFLYCSYSTGSVTSSSTIT